MNWTDVFEIKYDAETVGLDIHHVTGKFVIVEKATGKIIGSYEDQAYAIKQAKHKFKRYSKKIERMLLG